MANSFFPKSDNAVPLLFHALKYFGSNFSTCS